jgi:hypothetical protein
MLAYPMPGINSSSDTATAPAVAFDLEGSARRTEQFSNVVARCNAVRIWSPWRRSVEIERSIRGPLVLQEPLDTTLPHRVAIISLSTTYSPE